MLELIVTYRFSDAGSRNAFYRELAERGIRALCEAERGCLRYEYFFPCENERELMLLELWQDAESQLAHTGTAHFGEIGALKIKYNATTELVRHEVTG